MDYKLIYGYLCHDLKYDFWIDEVAANEFCEQLNLVAVAAGIEKVHSVRVARDGKSWCILPLKGEQL